MYASPPLFLPLFLPLLFLHSRLSSLVLHRSFSHFSKEFVTTASSTDASLTLSLSMPLCSSWPYATRKPNLKITIEFRVCALDRKRRRERARQRRRRWERFPRPCLICNILHTVHYFFTRISMIFLSRIQDYITLFGIINSLKKKKETEDDPHEQFGSSDLTKDSAMNTHH